MSAKATKKHIKRLEAMLINMDRCEARLQRHYGDMSKGSMRSSLVKDSDALRSVLAFLEAQE